jgi:hypothetical protein
MSISINANDILRRPNIGFSHAWFWSGASDCCSASTVPITSPGQEEMSSALQAFISHQQTIAVDTNQNMPERTSLLRMKHRKGKKNNEKKESNGGWR